MGPAESDQGYGELDTGAGTSSCAAVTRSGDGRALSTVPERWASDLRTLPLCVIFGWSVAGLVVGTALLTGCSEKVEANDTLPSTSAAETTEALPPVGPADFPVPDEARTKDAAGAEAFLRYYIDLINRQQAIPAGQPLRDLGPDCQDCLRIARHLRPGRSGRPAVTKAVNYRSIDVCGAPIVENGETDIQRLRRAAGSDCVSSTPRAAACRISSPLKPTSRFRNEARPGQTRIDSWLVDGHHSRMTRCSAPCLVGHLLVHRPNAGWRNPAALAALHWTMSDYGTGTTVRRPLRVCRAKLSGTSSVAGRRPSRSDYVWRLSDSCALLSRRGERQLFVNMDFRPCPQEPGRVIGYFVIEQRPRVRSTERAPLAWKPVRPAGAPSRGARRRTGMDVRAGLPRHHGAEPAAVAGARCSATSSACRCRTLTTQHQPPGDGLSGLPVIFYTDSPTTQTFTVDIRGFTVVITATAEQFTWHTGDRAPPAVTSTDPGSAVPRPDDRALLPVGHLHRPPHRHLGRDVHRERQRTGRRPRHDDDRRPAGHLRRPPGPRRPDEPVRLNSGQPSTTRATASASSRWPSSDGCTSFGSTSPAATESPPASAAAPGTPRSRPRRSRRSPRRPGRSRCPAAGSPARTRRSSPARSR